MADAGRPQLSQRDGMRIGLHGIEHIAGKAVEELFGGGGEFLRMHQIERLARLQAFDRFQRRWRSAAACRSGRERSSPVIQSCLRVFEPRGLSGQEKRAPPTGEALCAIFVTSAIVAAVRRRRHRVAHRSMARDAGHHAVGRIHAHHARWPSCGAGRAASSSFCVRRQGIIERGQRRTLGLEIGQALLQHVFLAAHAGRTRSSCLAVPAARTRWPQSALRRLAISRA